MLLFSLCVAGMPAVRVAATEIASEDVRQAVETWVRQVTADARPDAVVQRLEPHLVGGQVAAYVAHLEGGGYCLCGTDDLVLPVYLYIPEGQYDPEAPTCRIILDEISQRTAVLRTARQQPVAMAQSTENQISERRAFWQAMISGQAPPRPAPQAGGPPSMMILPMTSTWDQGFPYNSFCPTLTPGAGETTVTGCVATATAQIMYYWKWPITGSGVGTMPYPYFYRFGWSFEPLAVNPGVPAAWPWTGRLQYDTATASLKMNGYWDQGMYNEAIKIAKDNTAYTSALAALWSRMTVVNEAHTVNFGARTYNWGLMRDSVSAADASGNEVAKLMYDAGVACLMHWGLLGSTTGNTEKERALRENFLYDSAITSIPRDVNSMTDEIQWFRPVSLGGDGPAGGHDWVVFGYNTGTDPARQFRMNFGWSGSANGWYSYDAVNTPNGAFNQNQWQVMRIAPRDVVRFVGSSSLGDGRMTSPYRDVPQALQQAPNGTTLVFKAGSVNGNGGNLLVLNRPLVLKGFDVIIQR